MTLTINDSSMTSDRTAHTARHAPDRNGWEVSWLPGQTLDRNTAITAMILADTTAEPDLHEGHRLWPHIQSWAARTRPDRTRRDRPGLPAARRHRPPPGTSQPAARPRGSRLRPARLTASPERQCPVPVPSSLTRKQPRDRCMRPITA